MPAVSPMLTLDTDAELVAGLRAGDAQAFELLVRRHSAPLLRLARRFLGNEEDARDALQDAMVAVYRSIGSFEGNAMLSTWLHRIVVNACLMKLRSKRRRPDEVDIESLLPTFIEDGHQTEPSTPWTETAESMLEREETRALVRGCISMLPDAYRIVLHLRDIEEMSTEETAEILGITRNAVKIRLHRARQALRTLLDRHMK
jgi:RNA polymerase sigma-70 factor, ECF subfamily